ncbi:unnamed protein product [Calicophoron daubneyi]|uniref:Dicer-1 n=1 Tax=Calicophoron daubneyi TaxID=300641 RepID=A0AAV2T0K6_CALDB
MGLSSYAVKDTLNIDWEFVNLVLSSYGPEGVCRLLPRRNLDSTPVPTSPGNPVKTKMTERCRDMPSTMVRGTTVRSRASHRARSLASKLAMDPLLNQPGIFEFREKDFLDTVVMPAYRNLDQPQHYYVAEIRYDLSPLSPFPSSAYPNFAAYYTTKYEAALTTMEQPLLDVDFTVLRLNLLVPRYLDIRGHCLPCSTEARKRDRRENLTHKQILIPELCFRHPFPASVWRKAVCLPSILYRLHCLLLAEELRRRIAYETSLGRARLPKPKSILKDEFMNTSSITNHDLFEPLRLRFPLDLKQEGSEGEPTRSAEKAGSSGRGRRRRRRGQRDPKEKSKSTITPEKIPEKSVNQRKEQLRAVNTKGSVTKGDNVSDKEASVDSTKGDELEEGELEDEAEEAPDEDDESMNERESPDTAEQSKPTVLRLQATTAASGVPSSSSTNGRLRVNGIIESLLEETKVIELDEIGSVDVTENPDSDALMLIQNKMNADKEYFETGSDVESFDSFEGICRFFPSDDDREVDDEGDENDGQEPTFGHTSCTGTPTTRAYRPGPANVLQALTMSCSNDFINLERMETIGDSFLKFVVTVHLYLSYPQAHEGRLSHLRSRVVCNANLHRLGRIKHLPDRMVAGKFSPCENWVPPGYVVRHDKRQNNQTKKDVPAVDLNIWSTDPLMDDEVLLGIKANEDVKTETVDNFAISDWDPDAPEVVQTQHKVDQCLVIVQQAIPDKSVADCVEALVGCYLTSRGERSALRLMRWFGIDCLPAVDGYLRPSGAPWVQPPPAIGPSDPRWNNLIEAHLAWRFDELETRLQYTFKDPSLLIQAFTHPSYHQLRKAPRSNPDLDTSTEIFLTDTDCYQRLEFLGDAVLDYVITRFLYDDSKQHSPGVLTDLRSALVNNNIFAALAVRIGLHEFLRASSPQLLYTIDAFVRYQKEVVKDDLDFITNEDIEIRPPDPVDPLREETTHSLAGNIANLNTSIPPSRSESSQEDGQTCTKEGVSLKKETGAEVIGEEDEDHETADAGVLVDANDRESQWQESEAQKLMENFVGVSATTKQSVPESKPTPACGVSSSASTTGRPTAQVVNRVSDDLEIPKALGDIFESLAGAIFLDSGLSLDTVWAVFYPLMKERIERYTACIPKSPVRQLLELEPEGTKFERPRRTADGRVSVCAHVLGKGRFYGIGRNYRLAKSLAAKRALRVLRKLHRTQPLSVDSPSTGQKI